MNSHCIPVIASENEWGKQYPWSIWLAVWFLSLHSIGNAQEKLFVFRVFTSMYCYSLTKRHLHPAILNHGTLCQRWSCRHTRVFLNSCTHTQIHDVANTVKSRNPSQISSQIQVQCIPYLVSPSALTSGHIFVLQYHLWSNSVAAQWGSCIPWNGWRKGNYLMVPPFWMQKCLFVWLSIMTRIFKGLR